MTKDGPRSGEETRRHLVDQAERQLAAYGAELDAVIEDIRAGKFGPSRELATVVAALRKALEAVFSERAKLDRMEQETGRGRGELDLAAARAEVRRRMDRLRTALDAREVPEGPQ